MSDKYGWPIPQEVLDEDDRKAALDRAIVRNAYPKGLAAKIRECRERDRKAKEIGEALVAIKQ